MNLVVGVDFSITSPGVVAFGVDDNWNVVKTDFMGMTEVKKTSEEQPELIYYKKKDFKSEQERYNYISERIVSFVKGCITYDTKTIWVALEGYAMGAKGLIFNIAEATGVLKHKLWDLGYNIRIYEPTLIKKYATGVGNSDKVYMGDAFLKVEDSTKPMINDGLREYESPKADIVDAYWIAILLKHELMLRHGVCTLRDITDVKKIEVFNATSKHNKENILCRDFIVKA